MLTKSRSKLTDVTNTHNNSIIEDPLEENGNNENIRSTSNFDKEKGNGSNSAFVIMKSKADYVLQFSQRKRLFSLHGWTKIRLT